MDLTMSDEDITKMAKARVGFKVHAAVYVLVNVLLMGLWMMTVDGRPMHAGSYWPMWTHLGWGLGLAIHGFMVYGPGSGMQAREEAMIRERLGGR